MKQEIGLANGASFNGQPSLANPSSHDPAPEEGELGEDEIDQHPSTGAHSVSQLKRQQRAAFDSWFRGEALKTDFSAVKKSRNDSEKDDADTIKEMLKRQTNQKIINEAHAFQLELFERAKIQNTIVVVDTGAGKTMVAMLLLRHIIDQDIEARALGQPRKIAFFLVEKVTLMLQQFMALRANLPYDIENISGHYKPEDWKTTHWESVLERNDIIVCTAAILHQALMRSFVRMDQINLLIFDEAHHAKKDHTYAKIMRDFYKDSSSAAKSRPRIFGMTASPIDVQEKSDIHECARDLEVMLDAKIATVAETDISDRKPKPQEDLVKYRTPPMRFETALYRMLNAKYWDLKHFASLFDRARQINRTLGSWCSDAFWSFAFSEKEVRKQTAKLEQHATKGNSEDQAVRLKMDQQIADLHAAHEEIQRHQLREPRLSDEDLSPKVVELYRYLLQYFERPSDARCLVFVEKRETARLLEMVSQYVGNKNMRCGLLIGSSTMNHETERYTFNKQVSTMQKFRKGDLNCLFATTVAEEGLDVPDCNLVVRFDLCKTMIQYVQSRGRARHRNSKFVHLVEEENQEELDLLDDIHDCESEMKDFCNGLKQDRRIIIDDDYEDESGNRFPVFTIRSTGAKLTHEFSFQVLNHYCSMIPHDDETDSAKPQFNIFIRDGKFVAEVTLPERANISPITGKGYSKKIHARMSAAWEACIQLRRQGLLDDRFLPFYVQQLHHMREARLAIKSKRQKAHEMQLKPSIWENDRGTIPVQLYLTVLLLDGDWERSVKPLALLTRRRIPQLPDFPVFNLAGRAVQLRLLMQPGTTTVCDDSVSQLTWFTLAFFKDIYNKTFEEAAENMDYWIAPLTSQSNPHNTGPTLVRPEIDWDLLKSMHGRGPIKWDEDRNVDLENQFIVDPWDGSRRFFSKAISQEHRATDPVPENIAPGPKGKPPTNIIEYSSSLFQRAKARRTWEECQPVFEAERIKHRLNVLAPLNEQEETITTRCFLCPEPLDISRLPAEVAAMGLLFPSIIHRIEDMLIALEFCEELDLHVDPARALEAITKDSDNSEDVNAERVNFQRGMGPNYERLEFIGDTFLKMATSLATFIGNAGKDEYWMHVDRMTLLCNANMFNNAQHRGFAKYIRSKAFSRRTWYPQGMKLLQGKGAGKKGGDSHNGQNLSDKSIADVCEAMIGAALVSHVKTGYEKMQHYDDAVRAVTAFVTSESHQEHTMNSWSDYAKAYKVPKYQTASCSNAEIDIAKRVEDVHDYKFKHVKLLTSAFTHPSLGTAYSKNAPSYQRLEFLGDSLLDMTAVKHLFYTYPHRDPQWLTEHKMALVSNKFLGALCAKLGFNRFITHNSAHIRVQITNYMEEFQEAVDENPGSRNFWESLHDPPKCMADVVESYVGAMFIDSGFDFSEVQRFFDQHINWFFEDMSIYDDFANEHPVNRLRELLQTSMGCKQWRLMAAENPSDDGHSSVVIAGVLIHDTVIGKGEARTSKVAKIVAAKEAYNDLAGLPPFEFRRRFNCKCSLGPANNDKLETQEEDTAI